MADPTTHVQRTERFDLNALYETSRVLSASLDLEFVLNNLLLTAMSKLLVTRGMVLLYDPLESAYRVALSKGIAGLTQGERLAIRPPADGTMLQGDDVPLPLAAHRVALVLPVRSGYREIGLIALSEKATRQPFERRELEFIQSMVNMTSAAVHNSIMVEELKQANRDLDGKIQQLNTLFDLSQEFNGTVDRQQVIKLLSFALMGQMLVGKYLFLLRRVQNGRGNGAGGLQVVTSKGIADPELEAAALERLCGQREMVRLADDPDPVWDGLRGRGLSIVLPLQQHGETCGVLCLGPKMTGQPYQQADLEFLYALGNLAFVSIQNTFLVEERIEREKLEEEMRLARHIQERLLPQTIPSFPDVDIATFALPSRQVGGDYFDVAQLEGPRILLAIADVTGKGVPAALLMANLQASLHVLFPMPVTIEEATAHINRVICENTDYDKFITYFHGIYHRESRAFQYVNAGHNPPMLVRPDGSLRELETGGLLLGVMQNMKYRRGDVELAPGDVLVMFTDGVTEAMSPTDEEYGEERLRQVLLAHRHATAREILDAVYADIRRHTGEAAVLSDDLTMIVFRVCP